MRVAFLFLHVFLVTIEQVQLPQRDEEENHKGVHQQSNGHSGIPQLVLRQRGRQCPGYPYQHAEQGDPQNVACFAVILASAPRAETEDDAQEDEEHNVNEGEDESRVVVLHHADVLVRTAARPEDTSVDDILRGGVLQDEPLSSDQNLDSYQTESDEEQANWTAQLLIFDFSEFCLVTRTPGVHQLNEERSEADAVSDPKTEPPQPADVVVGVQNEWEYHGEHDDQAEHQQVAQNGCTISDWVDDQQIDEQAERQEEANGSAGGDDGSPCLHKAIGEMWLAVDADAHS